MARFEEGQIYWMQDVTFSVPVGYKVIRRTAKMVTLASVDADTLEVDEYEEPRRYRINGNDCESVEVKEFCYGAVTLYASSTAPYKYEPKF